MFENMFRDMVIGLLLIGFVLGGTCIGCGACLANRYEVRIERRASPGGEGGEREGGEP